MDEIRYVCLCQRQFLSLKALNDHQSTCADCVCSFGDDTCKITSCSITKEFSQMTPAVIIKIVKGVDQKFQTQNVQNTKPLAPNLLGRKLPNRTKVPFLSRAVPLSTDHSFEQCTCGAVFVTKVGKRQHQARFCKNVNNKNRNKSSNVMKEFRVVSVAKQMENIEINNEDSVIENQGCFEIVEGGYLKSLSEESFKNDDGDQAVHVMENNGSIFNLLIQYDGDSEAEES